MPTGRREVWLTARSDFLEPWPQGPVEAGDFEEEPLAATEVGLSVVFRWVKRRLSLMMRLTARRWSPR